MKRDEREWNRDQRERDEVWWSICNVEREREYIEWILCVISTMEALIYDGL